MKFSKHFWLVVGILSLGLFFRIYRYESYPFGFDQIQIFENSEKILSGDLTLIGPRTGRATMFTGPLIYYLHALVSVFSPSIYSLVVLSSSLALITGVAIYMFSKRVFGEKKAMIVLGIWAVSPYLIQMDRVTWNPNLMLLATALSLMPLYAKKLGRSDFLWIFLGSFLGFQAHFSGLLLPFLVSLFSLLIYSRRNFWWASLSGLMGLMVSLVPTFVFDLRNNWLNVKGFMEFFGDGVGGSLGGLIGEIIHSLWISVENVGKVFFLHNTTELIHFVGLVVLIASVWLVWKRKNTVVLTSLCWIGLIGLGFGLYGDSKPEYYYMIQIPAILILYVELFTSFVKKKLWWVVSGMVYMVWVNVIYAFPSDDMDIGNQMRVVEHIQNVATTKGISQISYDIEQGNEMGLQYLLSDLNLNENGAHMHISYPEIVEYDSAKEVGKVYVWQDMRGEGKHVTQKDLIIVYPEEMDLFESFGSDQIAGVRAYVVQENGNEVGKFSVLGGKEADMAKDKLSDQCGNCGRTWTKGKYDLGDYAYMTGGVMVYFEDGLAMNEKEVWEFLSRVEIY